MSNQDILTLLKETVTLLDSSNYKYALAGGLVASIYRKEKRFTEDIDFLLYSDRCEESSRELLKELGYNVRFVKLHELKKAPMMNKKSHPPLIAVGRSNEKGLGVDFILPNMPWFSSALERAQSNLLDFGFKKIPCITVEDVIIAKVFAGRSKDEDDISSILENRINLDLEYLISELRRLEIKVSREFIKRSSKEMRKILKKF